MANPTPLLSFPRRRELYILSAIILVIPAQAGIGLGLLLVIFNRGNNSVLCFYLSVIRDMNLIDPIPALSTPQIHSYLRGPRARE